MPFSLRLIAFILAGFAAVPAFGQPAPDRGMDRIPAPTGPWAVGRTGFHWTDSTRADPLAPGATARRELVVQVWYPAELKGPGRGEYIPHAAAIAAAIGDSAMAAEFGTARTAITTGQVRSYSIPHARLKKSERDFRVLIFSPGFGESSLTYSAQLEEMASQGYVVFGLEHPYDTYAVELGPQRIVPFARAKWDSARALPHGAVAYQLAQVPLRAGDIRFVIDQLPRLGDLHGPDRFADAVDLNRIGAFGHSLGGMAAASACREDARIRACLNEDADDEGRPYDGGIAALPIKQPFLFFATDHSIYVSRRTPVPTDSALAAMKLSRPAYDSIVRLYQDNQDRALEAMPGGAIRVMAEAPDFTHRSFIDLKVLQARDSAAIARETEYLQVIRRYVVAFFDFYLREKSDPPLERDGVIDSLITIERYRRSGR